MHVLKFGRGRDGSPHEDIVKNYEKVSINAKQIFWDEPKLIGQIYDFR